MIVETKHFGKIEYDESMVITFEDGIPGFEFCKKYVLVTEEDNEYFKCLQCLDDLDVCFVIMDVFTVLNSYNPLINASEIADLGDFKEDLLIYNIVVVPDEMQKMTVNLKAPLVINDKTKKGKQLIVNNDDYSIKYHIYDDIKKKD